jgi:RNA polymerase sigma factor (sigma-70 family)
MLADSDEAEDAVQHTFMAAYTSLQTSDRPMHLRAWLYTIARNRCYSIIRARREQPSADLEETAVEGLADAVQRREELRDLVHDMRQLPEAQRAALVLAELDALPHAEIAEVLSVPRDKVKALVFQARESLVASRTARDTACAEIREQLACGRGASLRRANLRRHLRECDSCRAFRAEVEHQRRQFAALIPIVPTVALKQALFGAGVAGTGAAAVGTGVIAGGVLKSGLAKGFVAAVLAGVSTAGTIVVSTTHLRFQAIINAIGNDLRHGAAAPRARAAHRSSVATVRHAGSPTASGAVTSLAPSPAAAASRLSRLVSSSQTWGGSARELRDRRAVHHLGPAAPAAPAPTSVAPASTPAAPASTPAAPASAPVAATPATAATPSAPAASPVRGYGGGAGSSTGSAGASRGHSGHAAAGGSSGATGNGHASTVSSPSSAATPATGSPGGGSSQGNAGIGRGGGDGSGAPATAGGSSGSTATTSSPSSTPSTSPGTSSTSSTGSTGAQAGGTPSGDGGVGRGGDPATV